MMAALVLPILVAARASGSGAPESAASQLPSSRLRAPPALASLATRRKLVSKVPEQGGRAGWIGDEYKKQQGQQTDLLCFYGNDCEMCSFMATVIKDLERDNPGMKIKRFETWSNRENDKLRELCDGQAGCGGVPFFYNKKTKAWICGATTGDNLKRWATGQACASFLPPATQFKSQQAPKGGTGARKVLSDLRERSREALEERRRLAEEARELKRKEKAAR